MNGLSTAINEITLVLFTTLAPSGAFAYVLTNLPILVGNAGESSRRKLDRFSCLPLAITMVGLIASATHLGNPANALYVFTGVGRSPLSTEVFCAVIFLALAGIYWLYSFAVTPRLRFQRVLLVITDIAALLFVVATAYAYNVSTIPTWSLPLAPVSLLLNAFVGGPVVALFCFAAAAHTKSSSFRKYSEPTTTSMTPLPQSNIPRLASPPIEQTAEQAKLTKQFSLVSQSYKRILLGLSTVALVINLLVYILIGMQLASLGNELTTATELVPHYSLFVAAFAILAAAGIAISLCSENGIKKMSLLASQGLATTLVLTAIFLMRFSFYMSHLTIGLGV